MCYGDAVVLGHLGYCQKTATKVAKLSNADAKKTGETPKAPKRLSHTRMFLGWKNSPEGWCFQNPMRCLSGGRSPYGCNKGVRRGTHGIYSQQ